MRVLLAVGLLTLTLGCGGAADRPSPVDRPELLAAFAAIGEPLTLTLDARRALVEAPPNSGSVVDAIFVPASTDLRPSPVQITVQVALFESEDAARERSRWVEYMSGDAASIVVHKNVSLLLAPSVTKERRDKLVSALMSL